MHNHGQIFVGPASRPIDSRKMKTILEAHNQQVKAKRSLGIQRRGLLRPFSISKGSVGRHIGEGRNDCHLGKAGVGLKN
jgi:hypothetical protein